MFNGGNSMSGVSNGNSFSRESTEKLEPQLIYPDPARRMP